MPRKRPPSSFKLLRHEIEELPHVNLHRDPATAEQVRQVRDAALAVWRVRFGAALDIVVLHCKERGREDLLWQQPLWEALDVALKLKDYRRFQRENGHDPDKSDAEHARDLERKLIEEAQRAEAEQKAAAQAEEDRAYQEQMAALRARTPGAIKPPTDAEVHRMRMARVRQMIDAGKYFPAKGYPSE